MNALEQAITQALSSQGSTQLANKAYLEFIKANFIIPVEKDSEADPQVLFLQENNCVFLPVFSHMDYFHQWAQDIQTEIQILKLSGVDLLKGLGDEVVVCLNIGSDFYKEFNPSELARMRSMVLKFFNE